MISREHVQLFVGYKADGDAWSHSDLLRLAVPSTEWQLLLTALYGFILTEHGGLAAQQQARFAEWIKRTFDNPADAEELRQLIRDEGWTPGFFPYWDAATLPFW